MSLRVDLNADLGEGAGRDAEILPLISSASIACGWHAGDPATISQSIRWARAAGVAIGAHPSLADRKNFGRKEVPVTADEVCALIAYQLGALAALAHHAGVNLRHVKPHGALYNLAARNGMLAQAIAQTVAEFDAQLVLFAPCRSELARAGTAAGLRVAREVFADRQYLADGSLVPRSRPDALLHDAEAVAERAVRMVQDGVVRSIDGSDLAVEADTICLHGDSPEAVAFARALRQRLDAAHVVIAAPPGMED